MTKDLSDLIRSKHDRMKQAQLKHIRDGRKLNNTDPISDRLRGAILQKKTRVQSSKLKRLLQDIRGDK